MTASLTSSWTTSAVFLRTRRPSLSPTELPLDELIRACQRQPQDRAAFTELIRRHQSQVDRLLTHLAPDWPDRADLAQEAWIRAYRYLPKLQDPGSFRSWLSRIVTNLFYDELRRRRRQPTPLSLDAPLQYDGEAIDWDVAAPLPSPDDVYDREAFYEQLRQAIATLPDSFRTTIVLREIEGLAYEEIAEITGVSLGTVKSRIARARLRLQELLRQPDC